MLLFKLLYILLKILVLVKNFHKSCKKGLYYFSNAKKYAVYIIQSKRSSVFIIRGYCGYITEIGKQFKTLK